MYRKQYYVQLAFEDFDQPLGLTMNPQNRWVKKAEMIPWSELEQDYAKLFKNKKGNIAKPFRMAFGSLLIQTEYSYSDEETVAQIQENPYLQFFIGLSGYQQEKPFDSSTMVYFRKRLTPENLQEINDKIIAYHNSEHDSDDDGNHHGTLMLDATCVPSNIKYPQDVELLNDARKHSEELIDELCQEYHLTKPRTNRRQARRAYLAFAKTKKRTRKIRRTHAKKLSRFVTKNLKSLNQLLAQGAQLNAHQSVVYATIQQITEQQLWMLTHQTPTVPQRIVSFHQPFIRPIVRGKAKSPTEFGAKLDLSQSDGFVRIECLSFEAFNESTDFIPAVIRYKERTGAYPKRVLVDKIYRTRENIAYCKERGIRLTGPKLGRPPKEVDVEKLKQGREDERDRIQIEREISLAKRCHGMGLVRTKLKETTFTAIHLAIISLNLKKIQRDFLCALFQKITRLFFSYIENRLVIIH